MASNRWMPVGLSMQLYVLFLFVLAGAVCSFFNYACSWLLGWFACVVKRSCRLLRHWPLPFTYIPSAACDLTCYLQEPMWGELRGCRLPMLLVAGQLDAKFAGIKRRMFARLRQGLAAAGAAAEAGAAAVEEQGVDLSAAELGAEVQQQQGSAVSGAGIMHQWAEVPGAGHAVHVEAPLQLLQLVRGFMQQLQEP